MDGLIIFGLIALVLAGVGTFIWTKEATYLLANFPKDPAQIRDRKGLARWAGTFLWVLAGVFLLEGYLVWKFHQTKYELVPLVVLIPVVSLVTVIFLVLGQRFVN
ncbi:hypothetical protein GCM10027275_00310 [Rhabdobacter roseus]|uniref:Putative membrane protein n=1 Tax=Rhabdobacter roseus TaxID=1655419 RepID=A0A840TG48_9BACT|nr:DUF3784 domain-containing protein [Rhabdobacter roseus]MBB5281915.1 putative membrane protein [Rhabdobacter roseus]